MSSGSEGCLQGLGHGPGHWDLGDEGAPGMVLLQRGGLGAGAPSQGRPEAMARGASATPQVRRQQALDTYYHAVKHTTKYKQQSLQFYRTCLGATTI